ncbi:DegV family protein [Bacillota bacterium LX-D]|nr:DegV family protein [Bacillota bacterium LX-D]
MKIAIVTDSTCDLEQEYLAQHDIYVLPLKVVFKDRQYHDRVDLQPKEFYARLAHEIPSTSMPGPGEVAELFSLLESKGYDHVLAVHISSGLSGTFNVVKMVAQQFPNLKVEVIDSKALSLGLGFLVMKAVQLRDLGEKFSDLVKQTKETQKKTKIFFIVKTLEYLKKGGRIGLIQSSLGELLDIKPIISVNEEGKYYTFAKVRGRKKSIEKLKELVLELIQGRKVNLAVAHSDAEEEGRRVLQDLVQAAGDSIQKYFLCELGPGMVVHCGPGLLGIIFNFV